MATFYVETLDNTSNRWRGAIDPRNGFPTIHSSLTVERNTEAEARAYFETKFPGNVMAVIALDLPV